MQKLFTLFFTFTLSFSLLANDTLDKKNRYEANFHVDIPITISSFLLAFIPSKVATPTLPAYMKNEPVSKDDVNAFDRLTINAYSQSSVTASDVLATSMAILPLTVNWMGNNTKGYFHEALIFAETLAISSALNNMIKYSVNRPRPYIYSGKASDAQKNDRDAHLSFYSGHTSFAFSAAVSFSVMFGERFDKGWQQSLIWGIPLVLASSVGFFRVKAGKHFLTDVLTGAVIGSSIGYLVPYLHKKSGSSVMAGGNQNGFMISYSGNF